MSSDGSGRIGVLPEEPGQDAFTPSEFRSALGSFATGVTVVTTRDREGNPVGLTVNSFASLSLAPPLILWSLRNESSTMTAFRQNSYFAVNVLAEAQEEICRIFASPKSDKFAHVAVRSGLGRIPLLHGVSASFECTREAVHPGGDHHIFIGRVTRVSVSSATRPLVHCRGSFLKHPSPISYEARLSS
jgi:flavin reductase (DIM6/NTAB) family NADH-FMN oxidoreductase RutF